MNNLGRVAVGMFFMITGYLFTVKAAESTIDWKRFARHRFFRLFPLYFVVVVLVHLVAFGLTGWQLKTTLLDALKNTGDWLAFTIRDRPDINGFAHTEWIIAGVNWTLKYEIFFYVIATPLLHFGLRHLGRKTMAGLVFAGCFGLYLATRMHVPNAHHLLNLALGVACAFVLPEFQASQRFPRGGAVAAILALIALLFSEQPEVVFLSSLTVFVFIASLVQPAHVVRGRWMAPFQWLGEISYSLYLTHGVALFLAYRFFGVGMSMWAFWGLVMVLLVLIVGLASLSFRCIERPFMAWAR